MSAVARRYFVRAVEHLRQGDVDAARENFGAALELAPMFVEARISYATALARAGDAQRAVDLLRAGIARETGAVARMSLESALGNVLIAAGQYRGAEEAFVNASQAAGAVAGLDAAALHDRLARVRAKTGRFAESFDELLAAARASRGVASPPSLTAASPAPTAASPPGGGSGGDASGARRNP